MQTNIHLTWIDYSILLVYFGFVLGIGIALKRSIPRLPLMP